MNLEIRSVTNLFLININKKIIKMNVLKRMKITAEIKRETELKKEQLEFSNALSFYNQKIKKRIFYYLYKFKIVSLQVGLFVNQKFENNLKKKYLKYIQYYIEQEKNDNLEKIKQINELRLFHIKKQLFYLLISLRKQKKEELLKEDIMENLRAKARALLGDFN
jgi:hypothetical protein